MATLNTLRTRGGIIITIAIFVALIAFLVGDLFSAGGSIFNSRKMRVGTIDGTNIGYEEFLRESNLMGETYKMLRGGNSLSAQEQQLVYNDAWDQLAIKHSFGPSLESLGFIVSDAEQVDMINGVYISPVYMNFFMNRSTGAFDEAMMTNFLSSVEADDNMALLWDFFRTQAAYNRQMTKYTALVSSGFYANTLDVQQAVKVANDTYSVKYVNQPYNSVPDSLFNVSDSDVRKYYNSHKYKFKQEEDRLVQYVSFDVMPSDADYEASAKYINDVAEEFKQSKNPMQYASYVSQERPDRNYYKESELPAELKTIAFGKKAGTMYGPVLTGDTYKISRLAATITEPDTLGAKHILLGRGETQLADSLVTVIKKGGNFRNLAIQYSKDNAVQNGGDLGKFAPERMVKEFSDACIAAKKGEVFTVESQYGLHVVQLTYKGKSVKKAQVATITYTVDPSDATQREIYAQASNFLTSTGGTSEGFGQAVNELGLSKRTVRIKTDGVVNGLKNAKELSRWAYTNKQGAVTKEIMEIDGSYIIATISAVEKKGYRPFDLVAENIRNILVNEAKEATILKQFSEATSLDELADNNDLEIKTVDDVKLSGFFIPGVGVEPALLGAFAETNAGEGMSKPVVGGLGVYAFEVTGVKSAETATAESEKVKIEANSQYGIDGRILQAINEESNITDMRVKFF